VVAGFFAGRVVSYTVSAVATAKVAGSLESILRNYWTNPSSWIFQLLSLAAMVAFTMIPWKKVLHISLPAEAQTTQAKGQASST
jgi:hypothetical protein